MAWKAEAVLGVLAVLALLGALDLLDMLDVFEVGSATGVAHGHPESVGHLRLIYLSVKDGQTAGLR